MDNAVKTRLCWSCEGGLGPDDELCPYCGADLEVDDLSLQESEKTSITKAPYKLVSPENSSSPIPIPIYQPQKATPSPSPEDLLKAQVEAFAKEKAEKSKEAPPEKKEPLKAPLPKPAVEKKTILPPKAVTPKKQSEPKKVQQQESNKEADLPHDEKRRFFVALLGMQLGSTFFLFGLLLMLFGDGGILTVHWDSSYWPVYLVLSFPLFFIGARLCTTFNVEE